LNRDGFINVFGFIHKKWQDPSELNTKGRLEFGPCQDLTPIPDIKKEENSMELPGIDKKYVNMEPGSVNKIVALQGSPRKVGVSKTDILLQAFLQGCRDQGAETEIIYLSEKKINHCVGCFTCWTKTPGTCAFKDDVLEILLKQGEADLTVYAYPLYHFGINSLMKKYIERSLPLVEPFLIKTEDGQTTHPMREEVKSYAVILGVCGFPEVSHFGAASANFHYIANAGAQGGLNIVAEVYRPASEILSNPFYQDETDRVLDAAKKAGAQIVKNGTIDQDIIESIASVDLDIEALHNMANMAWNTCIQEGITMPAFQQKLIEGDKANTP
jgi:multimeric flavodoxin WrbA